VREFLRRLLRVLIEIVLSLAVGCAAAYQAYVVACDAFHCSGGSFVAIPIMLGAVVAGLMAAAVFFVIYRIKGRAPNTRRVIDAVAIVGVIALLVYPVAKIYADEDALREQIAAQQKAAAEKFNAARLAWIANLRASDAHGAPGVVPPMLKVEDDGINVVVENISSKAVIVALARVIEDAAAPTGWRGCAMRTSGKVGGTYYFYSLNAGERATYAAYDNCAEMFRGAAIEYRVGKDARDTGWWSDSAFAAPDGREYQSGE